MKGQGHRIFTKQSALRKVLRIPGVDLDYLGKNEVIKIGKRANVGNGTLGVLDYLWKKHRIMAIREIGQNWVAIST